MQYLCSASMISCSVGSERLKRRPNRTLEMTFATLVVISQCGSNEPSVEFPDLGNEIFHLGTNPALHDAPSFSEAEFLQYGQRQLVVFLEPRVVRSVNNT